MAVGIIAEYNPFHNGHLYQMEQIKKKYPHQELILVLSGNFTQRGDVSLLDKWTKTKIAQHFGINLVVELPFFYATQSADFFAEGAVRILEELQVDTLVFGSEGDDLDVLTTIAKCQLENPQFEQLVHVASKMGVNYPTAVSQAVYHLTGKKIDTPNDLLGISYIKAILKHHYRIRPVCIKRTSHYHNEELSPLASATAIRKALFQKRDVKDAVSSYVYQILNENFLHFKEDYFSLLQYKMLTSDDLEQYQGVPSGFQHLLERAARTSTSYDELIQKIKSKRYTYNHISRMLLHILIGFKKSDNENLKGLSYIRILGFDSIGRRYLNRVKKQITIPIISKFQRDNLGLQWELKSTIIYDLLYHEGLGELEFQHKIKEDKI